MHPPPPGRESESTYHGCFLVGGWWRTFVLACVDGVVVGAWCQVCVVFGVEGYIVGRVIKWHCWRGLLLSFTKGGL